MTLEIKIDQARLCVQLGNLMKRIRIYFALGLGLFFADINSTAHAQVYSSNVVGYINQPFFAGNNFIANQLSASGGNSLSNLFNQKIPQGSTFTKWDASQLQFLPISTYDQSSGWTINYELTYGEGGRFTAPATFTNTFVGTIWPYFNLQNPFNAPLVSGDGLLLLSCVIPIANATFSDVVGRNPAAGEFVKLFNAMTQTETITTFDGNNWNNGIPLLAVGQSAFFGLGNQVAATPEPSSISLFGVGLVAVFALGNGFQKVRQQRRTDLIS